MVLGYVICDFCVRFSFSGLGFGGIGVGLGYGGGIERLSEGFFCFGDSFLVFVYRMLGFCCLAVGVGRGLMGSCFEFIFFFVGRW